MTDRWWMRAVCRGKDVNLFFRPDKTERVPQAVAQQRADAAKALCRRCPVTSECLADAIATRDRYAIRAATTPNERRRRQLV